MIVALTNRRDITVDFLIHQTAPADLFRLNAEDLLNDVDLLLEPSRFELYNRINGRCVHSDEITGVWFRRPYTFTLENAGALEEVYKEQIKVAIASLVHACADNGARIMNDPLRARKLSNKAVQYTLAAQYFSVPEWYIASPNRVQLGSDAVVKALASYVGAEGQAPFTRRLDEVAAGPSSEQLPLLVQRRIESVQDARVVVVDGECFVAAMPHGSEGDWRRLRYDEQPWEVVAVPQQVLHGLPTMLRDCGLIYCSADFLVDAAGVWHFIDLNPNGQYGWLELKCGLPISAAIHNCLATASDEAGRAQLYAEVNHV